MNRFIEALKDIPCYFEKYWWSYIQESQYYFCDKEGNIILPESYFDRNPFRHFLMRLKYDLKYWDECNLEASIFEGKNYNLVEINNICRKYRIKKIRSIQVPVDGKYVLHDDISVKNDNKK